MSIISIKRKEKLQNLTQKKQAQAQNRIMFQKQKQSKLNLVV